DRRRTCREALRPQQHRGDAVLPPVRVLLLHQQDRPPGRLRQPAAHRPAQLLQMQVPGMPNKSENLNDDAAPRCLWESPLAGGVSSVVWIELGAVIFSRVPLVHALVSSAHASERLLGMVMGMFVLVAWFVIGEAVAWLCGRYSWVKRTRTQGVCTWLLGC